jgi:hypothetical protein
MAVKVIRSFGKTPARIRDEPIPSRLLDSFVPPDFMAQLLVKEVADSTWEATRLGRHKTLLMERRWRDRLKFQAQRVKDAAASKEACVNKPTGQNGKPSSDPEDVLEGLVEEIDGMVLKPLAELEHARALEVGIVYYERLNNAHVLALARRNNALEQLERYQDGLGHTLRRVSDGIIEGSVAEGLPQQVAAPAITSGEQSA